ncbi:MAG: glycosyltransferase family 4 protein [Anaerolineae bacterium]
MSRMRVLRVHNYYQRPGGEDVIFEAEGNLLREHGCEVREHVDHNDKINGMNVLSAASQAIWSWPTYIIMRRLIRDFQPDVVHFHNTFFMISPSAYYACHEAHVAVIQTLHNYRLSCPSAIFYRDGAICEECLGKFFPWPSIRYRCYRASRPQTAIVATMLAFHRAIRTWQSKVNVYIALTEFSRSKFIQAGLPAERIVVKPNFVTDPAEGGGRKSAGEYVLYAGRLSAEKGISTLLRAWKILGAIPLMIAGDGPLRGRVEEFAQKNTTVRCLGHQEHRDVQRLIRSARFVIVPSVCYENFPMIVVEAFSNGVPVMATRLGAMQELIRDGETGVLFAPGNPVDMASKVEWLWSRPMESARMGQNARAEYEQKYTPARNLTLLLDIYSRAMEAR